MSHQTGIKANETLLKVFGKSKDGKLRVIKVSIVNEELCVAGTIEPKKDWERDYDQLIGPLIDELVPCYILYRLDSKTLLGYAWLLISWVPDVATIRHKMVYASTKATLKTEFGSAHITEEQHATSPDEITLNGYYKNKKAFSAPAPLTTREEELQELKKTEVSTNISTDTRHQTLSGISCPLSATAIEAVHDMLRGSYDYLQFYIELEEEEIHLCKAAVVSLFELAKEIPNDHARYHLYLFKHTYEGDYQESYIFIYSMPGYSCSVRERMMYSSCKAPLLKKLQSFGFEIMKKIEIDDGSEITETFLQEQLHPKKVLSKPAFAKPKGPPTRGAKRMTRPLQTDQQAD